jgi:hypothetical protein
MKKTDWISGAVMVCASMLLVQPAMAGEKPIKNQNFVVNLTSPISTKDSKPGDTFTAVVIEPAEFQNAIVEGHVRTVEPAKNAEAPKARINFAFETLTVGDVTYKIQADLKEVVNSKGVAKVDEEGQAIGAGNGAKRAMMGLGGAGMGSLIGGMVGGGMGSLIGGAVGGVAGYAVALEMTASSHNIEFYPGTHFTLQVTSKGIDKGMDASAVRKQEADNEAATAAHAAATAGTTPSPAPDPSPSPAPNAAAPAPEASVQQNPAPAPAPAPSPTPSPSPQF